jgi:hypothetical protein
MIALHLTITLLSDAEPGTGLGSGHLNDMVPRNAAQAPCIRASHIKGLLRDRLAEIGALRDWPRIEDELLGQPGDAGDDGLPGVLTITDATTPESSVITITRTALSDLGPPTAPACARSRPSPLAPASLPQCASMRRRDPRSIWPPAWA